MSMSGFRFLLMPPGGPGSVEGLAGLDGGTPEEDELDLRGWESSELLRDEPFTAECLKLSFISGLISIIMFSFFFVGVDFSLFLFARSLSLKRSELRIIILRHIAWC